MANELDRIRALRERDIKLASRINPTTDVEGAMAGVVQDTQRNLSLALANSPRANMQALSQPVEYDTEKVEQNTDLIEPTVETVSAQPTGNLPRVTQAFGNKNPGVERFSGGINLGTDFYVKKGTPLALPPGEWQVVTAYGSAVEGDRGANSGSGNLVKVKNMQTGETLAFEHLDNVGVKLGGVYKGGTVIGKSGNTGNSTGPHASLPYKNAQGQYQDILNTPYARYIFAGQGGGAGFLDFISKKES